MEESLKYKDAIEELTNDIATLQNTRSTYMDDLAEANAKAKKCEENIDILTLRISNLMETVKALGKLS